MNYSVTEASRDKWLSVAEACPYATYFHTPYWYDIIAPGRRHSALEVTFGDGASAVIPVAQIKRIGGLLTDHFSSPGGTYGGWISASPLSEDHARALLDILMSKKNLTYRVNHLDKLSSALIPSLYLPSKRLKDDYTYILDLARGAEELFRGLAKGHRSAVKSAARDGVTVKTAETYEEWEQYYGIYTASVYRWRAGGRVPRTVYPRNVFRRIFESQTGHEALWLAYINGEPVAGAIFFYWNVHAVSWHGAALDKHFSLRPNNLLYWEIIRDAARRGCTVFDFNPSGGYSGVELFKAHFGTVRVPSPVLRTKTPLRSAVLALKKKIKKK